MIHIIITHTHPKLFLRALMCEQHSVSSHYGTSVLLGTCVLLGSLSKNFEKRLKSLIEVSRCLELGSEKFRKLLRNLWLSIIQEHYRHVVSMCKQ